MRIPHIAKRGSERKDRIQIIKLDKDQIPEVEFVPDLDMEDEKSIKRYVRNMKSMIRSSREYSKLVKFLKRHMNMNKCFYLSNVKQFKGEKISIEMHHTGLVMEDIIETVLRKRVKEEEPYHYQAIAKEVMLAHYKGMIALTPLSATCHELIHAEDSQLFIPLQLCAFGDMRLFYEEYKDYMQKDLRKKFETYSLMSEAFENLDSIIPDYMDVSIVYYEVEGIEIPRMDKILQIIDD